MYTIETIDREVLGAQQRGEVMKLAARGQMITLHVKHVQQFREAAWDAGEAYEDSVDLALLFMLAHVAITGEAPSQQSSMIYDRYVVPGIHELIPLTDQRQRAERSRLRELINDALQYGSDRFEVPQTPWALAYVLCGIGLKMWRLRGDEAYWWGSTSILDLGNMPLRALLLSLSAAMIAHSATSIPISEQAQPNEANLDWLALAGGPDLPPASILPAGLGYPVPTFDYSDHGLPWEQAQDLQALAAILLNRTARPPRYIGRLLDIPLSAQIRARVAIWDVVSVAIVPHVAGMWVALINSAGQHIMAAWWYARPESSERHPLTFPASLWVIMHPVFAAIWHDLCADVITVQRPPDLGTTAKPTGKPKKTAKPTKQRIILPPVRYAAQWGQSDELAAITHYTAAGHGYRRLPADWEERAGDRSFQQRQQQAAERAELEGMAAPPPGYTYVRAYSRVVRGHAPQGVVVRCRGLFTLVLGLGTIE